MSVNTEHHVVGCTKNDASYSCTSGIQNDCHSVTGNIPIINMEEEMKASYVKDFIDIEGEVMTEDIQSGINYISKLSGGLSENRKLKILDKAVEHIRILREKSRFDHLSGVSEEYTKEDLTEILKRVDECYSEVDIERVFKKFMDIYGFPPSPEEFIDQHEKMKAQLEETVKKNKEEECVLYERLKDLEEENQRLKESAMRSKCKICLDKEVQVLFNSCCHIVTCLICVNGLKKCPVCRVMIQGTTNVVLA